MGIASDILKRLYDVDIIGLDPKTELRTLQTDSNSFDSLARVQYVIDLENALGMKIVLEQVKTVGDVLAMDQRDDTN